MSFDGTCLQEQWHSSGCGGLLTCAFLSGWWQQFLEMETLKDAIMVYFCSESTTNSIISTEKVN